MLQLASQGWIATPTLQLTTRMMRIRLYRHKYDRWCQTGDYPALAHANALWDRMSETDRRFILMTEKR